MIKTETYRQVISTNHIVYPIYLVSLIVVSLIVDRWRPYENRSHPRTELKTRSSGSRADSSKSVVSGIAPPTVDQIFRKKV